MSVERLTVQKLSLTAALGAPAETVLLLHGFAGTGRTWDVVARKLSGRGLAVLTPDLPGHGDNAAHVGPITFQTTVEWLLAQAPAQFLLCGYSMGGRIALHLALAAPDRVSRLVLVSTTAGIADPADRAQRLAEDRALADRLCDGDFEEFVASWRTRDAFAGDSAAARDAAASEQRRNRPESLAEALRGLGTGSMEPLWGRLGELQMPVTVVAGDRDARFLAYGRRLADGLPLGQLVTMPGGHGLVWEQPDLIAAVLAPTG